MSGKPKTASDRILSAADEIRDRLTKITNEHRLRLSSFLIFRHLADKKNPVPLVDLAREVGCAASWISEFRSAFWYTDFVTFSKDKKDGRSRMVFITEAGVEMVQAIQRKIDLFEQDELSHILTQHGIELSDLR